MAVSIIVFGSTGDLMKKKLIPAFSDLYANGILGKGSKIIGVGRRDFNDIEFKEYLCMNEKKEFLEKINILDIDYFKGDISSNNGLLGLKKYLEKIESREKNIRIFYCATGYNFFMPIIKSLKKENLVKEDSASIVFEKPFGNNLESAEEIYKIAKDCFLEKQIYFIDHYLGKEAIRWLIEFKDMWKKFLSNEYIDKIEINVNEDFGVENRIDYYDKVGALKDVVQNHILETLAFLLSGEKREELLKKIYIGKREEQLLGQYISYKEEVEKIGIKESKRETFAKIVLYSKENIWKNIKFILKTGKKMQKRQGEIKIYFKEEMSNIEAKYIRKDGKILIIDIHSIDIMKGKISNNPHAFLINEIILHKKHFFPDFNEIKECWRIIDSIEEIRDNIKFEIYKNGNL